MSTSGHSSLRRSISNRKTRASIVDQYSIDLNHGDNEINEQEVDESDLNDALQVILTKPSSQMCRVSPLHDFEYTTVKLKKYALKIKQFLANNVKSSANLKYSAEISIVDNLKLEVSHNDALKIIVWGSSLDGGVQDKLLYHGVLFSWGALPQREPGVVLLPLLLDCGQFRVAVAVRRMLSKLFDCLITPLAFTQSHLLLFSALLSSFPSSEGVRLVNYVFQVPHTRLATTLDISLKMDDVHHFWKQCFDGEDTVVLNEQDAQRLYSVFQAFVHAHMGLDVASLQLVRLVYPGLTLHASGTLRLRELEAAHVTLRVLGKMATLLRSSAPKLAADCD